MIEKISQMADFSRQLEYSTQLMILAAEKKGLLVEVLDWKVNCIAVKKNTLTQILIQASNTTLDSYVTALLMVNKACSKKILAEAGLPIPQAEVFDNTNDAVQALKSLKRVNKDSDQSFHPNPSSVDFSNGIVIKPNDTNYGQGVMILQQNQIANNNNNNEIHRSVSAHIEQCLSMSSQVLIEEYIPGNEYRFLIVGERCVAVCQRIPANVIGDGFSTIQNLVVQKNQDPRRGILHRKPLQKIELDSIVLNHLQFEGFSLKYIPPKGKRIFLRKNSNISTGGESIDVTDSMPDSLKILAKQAAKAINSRLCGVDIILKDNVQNNIISTFGQSIPEKPGVILEINHNPSLFIHETPSTGSGQPVCDYILTELGF